MKTETLSIIQEYIIDCIDSSGYEIETNTTEDKLKFIWDIFNREKVCDYNLNRYKNNYTLLFANWIQGLPSTFNIEYENHKLLVLGDYWHVINTNSSEDQEEKFIKDYWLLIAKETFKLFREYGIN